MFWNSRLTIDILHRQEMSDRDWPPLKENPGLQTGKASKLPAEAMQMRDNPYLCSNAEGGYFVERKAIIYGANPEGCLEVKVFNRLAIREN